MSTMKLSARQVGAVGVARVTGALLRCGYNVLTPYEDFAGYDVVAEKDNKFFRIQVKTSQAMELNRDRFRFNTASGSEVKRLISGVDYVACWAMSDDLFWLIPIAKCKTITTKFCPSTGQSWRVFSSL
jgi:PD-(D/E)XK endonuclease